MDQGTLPDTLSVERRGNILVVRLARPDKRNALNDGMVEAIDRVFSSVPDDIGAIVLHGEGAHFSAGLDLSELTERDAVQGVMHSRMWHQALDRIQFGKAPVIAALHALSRCARACPWPATACGWCTAKPTACRA